MSIFKQFLLSIIPISFCLISSQSLAVGISCKATKIICNSPKIAGLNAELSALYKPYNRSTLLQQIQKDWIKTLETNCDNNDEIDTNQHTDEQKEIQEKFLEVEYQKQINFYRAINSPPSKIEKIAVPTSPKRYKENFSGDWRIYTLGTIPRYADQDRDIKHYGIIDNTVLAAHFMPPQIIRYCFCCRKLQC